MLWQEFSTKQKFRYYFFVVLMGYLYYVTPFKWMWNKLAYHHSNSRIEDARKKMKEQ